MGHYTHRVAISDRRILEVTDDEVSFSYKDYRDDSTIKVMKVSPEEFIRRYMLHILPKGFQKIRAYGFLAGSVKGKYMPKIRQALNMVVEAVEAVIESVICPECGLGNLQFIRELKAIPIQWGCNNSGVDKPLKFGRSEGLCLN